MGISKPIKLLILLKSILISLDLKAPEFQENSFIAISPPAIS